MRIKKKSQKFFFEKFENFRKIFFLIKSSDWAKICTVDVVCYGLSTVQISAGSGKNNFKKFLWIGQFFRKNFLHIFPFTDTLKSSNMQNLNLKFQKKLPKFPMRDTGGFSFLPFLSPLGTWIMKIYISVMEGFFEVDASTSILWYVICTFYIIFVYLSTWSSRKIHAFSFTPWI